MNDKIILIDHHDNARDDLAWAHLGEQGFQCQLVCPFQGEVLKPVDPEVAGVIIYGGSQNVGEQDKYPFLKDELRWIDDCIGKNIPLLGICLGGQLIAHCLGAEVGPRTPVECEFGYYPLSPTASGKSWMPDNFYVTQAHYEEFDTPSASTRLAASERFPNQAFCYGEKVFGLQFHPEVTPAVFQRWQNADWAMYDTPGSQTRVQQTELMNQHHVTQANWFKNLLNNLFNSRAGI